ncbi:hypothetical protein QQF45_18175 [Halopseudomonas aestusnigri]|uniref:hypothetical protein n=1 Tax=Halopseudomonas aestusnigri TaxID=857252 RepID=UPI002556059F|nr:hypothetical protein [Halopseudomonas aestusnigri]MDL2200970.1 hypothetical protein [Halopseudomonas aestusnigri]
MDGYSGKRLRLAASCKLQAASCKRQATSDKRQASSKNKLEAKSLRLWLRKEQDLTACCTADPDFQFGQHPMAAKLPHQTLAFGFWLLAFGFWLLAFGFWLLA